MCGAHMYHSLYMEVRGQRAGVGLLLLPHRGHKVDQRRKEMWENGIVGGQDGLLGLADSTKLC